MQILYLEKMKNKANVGLVALFVFFGILLNAPILNIPKGTLFGVPAIVLYIIIVWVGIIAMMAYLSYKNSKSDNSSK